MRIYFVLMALLTAGFFGVRFAFLQDIKKYFSFKMYLSVAAILAAGFVLHNALLFMAIASIALIVSVSSRTDALCRLTILVCLIPEVGQYVTVGGLNVTYLSTSQVLSFAALIACSVRPGSNRHRSFSPEDALMIVLFLCFGVGAVRGGTFNDQLREVLSMALALGLPYFVYRRFVHDRVEFALVVGVLAGAAMMLAFFAIAESRLHWAIYDTVYMNQSTGAFLSRNMKMRGGLLRAPTSFNDSTAYALMAMVGIFAVISSRRFFRNGAVWSCSIALTIIGMVAAQSRGADLGFLVGLFVMVVVRRRYALAAAVAGAGTILVAVLVALASSSPKIAAFIGADMHAGGDQDYRQTLLRRGLQVGMEHPILGDDMKRVIAKMSDIVQSEGLVDLVNSYLTIFLNSGLVGLSTCFVLIVAIFIKMFRPGRQVAEDQSFVSLQMFVAGALSGDLFALTFTSFSNERNTYWLILLLVCARGLQLQRRTGEPVPQNPAPTALIWDSGYRPDLPGRVADPV